MALSVPTLLMLATLLSVALGLGVVVSASAKFDHLMPEPNSTYRYLYYVTNDTWVPAEFRWDCLTGPYPSSICTTGCGYVILRARTLTLLC